MWAYEKKLEYPINIKQTNPALAKIVISQYGGPDGELGASLRYLSQRYSVPYPEIKAILTDIGTEECVPLCYQCGKWSVELCEMSPSKYDSEFFIITLIYKKQHKAELSFSDLQSRNSLPTT